MEDLNLLIGNGESLVGEVTLSRGPSTKAYPYSIEKARERLGPRLQRLAQDVATIPDPARPGGQGVGMFTVHPAFLAKTHLPDRVLRRAKLRAVGSRLVMIQPEHDARAKRPEGPQPAAELYVSGTEKAFAALHQMLLDLRLPRANQNELRRIETLGLLQSGERIGHITQAGDELALEVGLHTDLGVPVLESFAEWVRLCEGQTRLDKKVVCRGLAFLPVLLPRAQLERLAQFSLLRVLRSQPSLRAWRRGATVLIEPSNLPDTPPLAENLTTAIFDGGLAHDEFAPWVTEHVAPGLEAAHADDLAHGTAVTSAFLFGGVSQPNEPAGIPYTRVDHHRVVGRNDTDWYILNDVLNRIKDALQARSYDFVNLSLGPEVEVDDGHIHPWTSTLDEILSNGKTLAVVAAGNVPEHAPGQTLLQPPADAVNALTVGTANDGGLLWDRATNSCHGPGRSPGLVKPDGLAYSGTEHAPLYVPAGGGGHYPLTGFTSFGGPLVLRLAAGLRAVTDFSLEPTAPRALLIHHAERGPQHDWRHVGWGRFPERLESLLVSPDAAATVIYQGAISPGKPLRARIPLPDGLTTGQVMIRATFCFTTEVDPAHPINYTRAGLTIVFRPRIAEKRSLPFFSSGNLYASELDLRTDAHKWETVLSRHQQFDVLDLSDPIFDIEYLTRERGLPIKLKDRQPLPYVLVVTVSTDQNVPIYNKVLQKYPTLTPVRLRERVRLSA